MFRNHKTTLIRLFSIIICIYGFLDENIPDKYLSLDTTPNPFRFLLLSKQGVFLTAITLSIALIIRHFDCKPIIPIYNYFLFMITGMETLITFTFWIAYMIDPTYVVQVKPYQLGYRTPFFKEISMHGLPLIFIIYELWNSEFVRSYIFHTCIFLHYMIYVTSVYINFSRKKMWPYKFIRYFGHIGRISFGIICFLFSSFASEMVYFCLKKIRTNYRKK